MSHVLATPWAPSPPSASGPREGGDARRAPEMRELFDAHFDFIWRATRRLGLCDAETDDAAQQVFIIASRKLDAILPGRERAFLYGIAVRVVADVRKNVSRRHEMSAERAIELVSSSAPADQALDHARARACFDAAIADMPLELRTVFTLYEFEELTMAQIAEIVDVPHGTVASRLRRARDHFESAMSRLRKRFGGER